MTTQTLKAWDVAAIEVSLRKAIDRGEIEAYSGKQLLELIRDAKRIVLKYK